MSPMVLDSPAATHHKRLEQARPVMAKADLKNLESWREGLGKAVARALALAGLSQKEAAAAVGRDTAQIARWVAGTERPQLDTLFAVEALRQPLVIALAELSGAAEVTTTIKLKRIG